MLDQNWFAKERMDAIDAVIAELEKYQGEKVVAHKHPLHHAVVALEKLVDARIISSPKGLRTPELVRPAKTIWYQLLRQSRRLPLRRPWKFKRELLAVLKQWKTEEPEQWKLRLEMGRYYAEPGTVRAKSQ